MILCLRNNPIACALHSGYFANVYATRADICEVSTLSHLDILCKPRKVGGLHIFPLH